MRKLALAIQQAREVSVTFGATDRHCRRRTAVRLFHRESSIADHRKAFQDRQRLPQPYTIITGIIALFVQKLRFCANCGNLYFQSAPGELWGLSDEVCCLADRIMPLSGQPHGAGMPAAGRLPDANAGRPTAGSARVRHAVWNMPGLRSALRLLHLQRLWARSREYFSEVRDIDLIKLKELIDQPEHATITAEKYGPFFFALVFMCVIPTGLVFLYRYLFSSTSNSEIKKGLYTDFGSIFTSQWRAE